MKQKTLLKIILLVALAGLLFSGYLSFVEIKGKTASCPIAAEIFNIPSCVYGFFMYAAIFGLALFMLVKDKEQ